MTNQGSGNQSPNIFSTSLKVAINPLAIIQGVREIFANGDVRYQFAIVVAVLVDLVSILIRIGEIITLSSLVAVFEPLELILTIFALVLLFLTGFIGLNSLLIFLEIIPGIDILPMFTVLILSKWAVEGPAIASGQSAPIGSALTQGVGTSPFAFISILIIMFIAFVGLSFLVGSLGIPGLSGLSTNIGDLPGQAALSITQGIQEAPTMMAKLSIGLKNLAALPGKWFERQKAIATGDLYNGQVDKYADKDLGVFLKDVEPGEKEFYLGEPGRVGPVPIQIFGKIEGDSLEVDDCENYLTEEETINKLNALYTDQEINAYYQNLNLLYKYKEDCEANQNVAISCKVSNKNIGGVVSPENLDLFDLQGGGTAIDCAFNDAQLEPGTEIVDFKVKFPFVTKSYIKTYFMDILRLNDMKRQKLDPFAHYKITDKKPVAVYTGGPIMIGIGIEDNLPLTVSTIGEEEQRSFRLGITLENKWKGKIVKLSELEIIVPEGILLQCPLFVYSGDNNSNYKLSEIGQKQIGKGIETSKTYNCRIVAENAESAKKLLNNIPMVTKYIKVTARYDYELEESTTIRLKRGDSLIGDLTTCDACCFDYDGCFCNVNCEGLASEVSGGNTCEKKSCESLDEHFKAEIAAEKAVMVPSIVTIADEPVLTEEEIAMCQVYSQCSDYNKEQCGKDVCKFGCNWNGTVCVVGSASVSLSSGLWMKCNGVNFETLTAADIRGTNIAPCGDDDKFEAFIRYYKSRGIDKYIDPLLMMSLAYQESTCNPNMANGQGIMQVATRNDLFDVENGVKYGTEELIQKIQGIKSRGYSGSLGVNLLLFGYNRGLGSVDFAVTNLKAGMEITLAMIKACQDKYDAGAFGTCSGYDRDACCGLPGTGPDGAHLGTGLGADYSNRIINTHYKTACTQLGGTVS